LTVKKLEALRDKIAAETDPDKKRALMAEYENLGAHTGRAHPHFAKKSK
jgi:hypothetical protein